MFAIALLISYWTPNMGPKNVLFASGIVAPRSWREKRFKPFEHAPDLQKTPFASSGDISCHENQPRTEGQTDRRTHMALLGLDFDFWSKIRNVQKRMLHTPASRMVGSHWPKTSRDADFYFSGKVGPEAKMTPFLIPSQKGCSPLIRYTP